MFDWNTPLIEILVTLLLIAWTVPFVLGPVVLLKAAPTQYGLSYVALSEADDLGLPDSVRGYVEDCQRTLIQRGFAPRVRASNPTARRAHQVITLLECPRDPAMVFTLISVSPRLGITMATTFDTRFADGCRLLTSNSPVVIRTPKHPRTDGVTFPEIGDVGRLCDIHRARVAERARRVPVAPSTFGPDPLAFIDREGREMQDFWIARGYYRRVAADHIALTLKGATLATWRGLFPWRQLTQWNKARKARAVWRQVGFA